MVFIFQCLRPPVILRLRLPSDRLKNCCLNSKADRPKATKNLDIQSKRETQADFTNLIITTTSPCCLAPLTLFIDSYGRTLYLYSQLRYSEKYSYASQPNYDYIENLVCFTSVLGFMD